MTSGPDWSGKTRTDQFVQGKGSNTIEDYTSQQKEESGLLSHIPKRSKIPVQNETTKKRKGFGIEDQSSRLSTNSPSSCEVPISNEPRLRSTVINSQTPVMHVKTTKLCKEHESDPKDQRSILPGKRTSLTCPLDKVLTKPKAKISSSPKVARVERNQDIASALSKVERRSQTEQFGMKNYSGRNRSSGTLKKSENTKVDAEMIERTENEFNKNVQPNEKIGLRLSSNAALDKQPNNDILLFGGSSPFLVKVLSYANSFGCFIHTLFLFTKWKTISMGVIVFILWLAFSTYMSVWDPLSQIVYCSSNPVKSDADMQASTNDSSCVPCPTRGICSDGRFKGCEILYRPKYDRSASMNNQEGQTWLTCEEDGDVVQAVAVLSETAISILSAENGNLVCLKNLSPKEIGGWSNSYFKARLMTTYPVPKMSATLFQNAWKVFRAEVLRGKYGKSIYITSITEHGAAGRNDEIPSSNDLVTELHRRWHSESVKYSVVCRLRTIFSKTTMCIMAVIVGFGFCLWRRKNFRNQMFGLETEVMKILEEFTAVMDVHHPGTGCQKYVMGLKVDEILDELRRRGSHKKKFDSSGEPELLKRKVNEIVTRRVVSDVRVIRTKMYVDGNKESFISCATI